MDAQRNSPDQANRGWYGDGRVPAEPEWEGYRLPGPRGSADALQPDPLPYAAGPAYPDSAPPAYADPVYPAPALEVPTGQMPPVPLRAAEAPAPPGPPPPGRPGMNEPQRFHAEPIDRAALRRPPVAPVGEGVYRTGRPAVAVLLAALTVVFEVPAVRVLADAAVGGPVSANGIVAGTFLVAGLPMFAIGLYALVTGATRPPADTPGRGAQAWLRPPAVYLPIALILFLAAALATP